MEPTGHPDTTCPECGTTVHPGWDWCWKCGYDPEGLRADPRAQAAPLSRSPAPAWPPPGRSEPVAGRAPASVRPVEPEPVAGPAPALPPVEPGGRNLGPLAIAAAVVAVVAVVVAALATGSHPTKLGAAAPVSTLPDVSTTAAPAGAGAGQVIESSTDPGVPVTPAEAKDVAGRLWQERMTARNQRDVAALRLVEDGPALEADTGYICALGCRGPLETALSTTVNLPHQAAWPVHFFATTTYDLPDCPVQPCDDSYVAEQRSSGAPWKIVLVVSHSGNPFGSQPSPDAGGYSVGPDPLPARDFPNLPAEYAQYLQSLKDTGRPPELTRLGAGPFTSGLVHGLYNPAAVQQTDGWLSTVTYSVNPSDPVWQFGAVNGIQVTCGTVRFQDSIRPALGRGLVDTSSAAVFGGADVAPGTYSSIVVTGLHSACFEAYNQPGPVEVFGTWGDITHVATTPA